MNFVNTLLQSVHNVIGYFSLIISFVIIFPQNLTDPLDMFLVIPGRHIYTSLIQKLSQCYESYIKYKLAEGNFKS